MTVYALKHPDGRWLYHLPKPDAFKTPGNQLRINKVTGVFADGQPMEQLHSDWWATDHEATRLTATAQPSAKTTGYTLSDPDAESVRYPATLTLAQYEERRDTEDNLWEFYTSVREDQPAIEHVYDGPVMVLEGREPPRPDERQWNADLPHVLGGRPEYRHLFPGKIPGLRTHLHEVIKAMPNVRHCFDGYNGFTGLHVVLKVGFDKPVSRWQSDISRRTGKPLKSGRNVTVTVTRDLNLAVPQYVAGDNYEQALAAWDQQVEFWLSVVRDATVKACSACNGTGHVAHGAEKFNARS